MKRGAADDGEGGPSTYSGRKGSIIAEQYIAGTRQAKDGAPPPEHVPTNEELAKAVQQKVAVRSRAYLGLCQLKINPGVDRQAGR